MLIFKQHTMIDYVRGEIAEIAPAQAVIDCHGVGYAVSISLNTYSAIQGKPEAKLYVYEAIREDAYQLFGFATKQERELFLLLISVSGIGGNTARMILSALSPQELCNVISSGNEKLLKSVKGIGLKTAQRIIVDLKDKIATTGLETVAAAGAALPSASNEVYEEAVAALTMLGFAPAPSQKVVSAILKEDAALAVEKVIKEALKRL
jgi:Holliday junction DNA helicase RuvA